MPENSIIHYIDTTYKNLLYNFKKPKNLLMIYIKLYYNF